MQSPMCVYVRVSGIKGWRENNILVQLEITTILPAQRNNIFRFIGIVGFMGYVSNISNAIKFMHVYAQKILF